MKPSVKYAYTILMLLMAGPLYAEDKETFPGIKSLMTPQEYEAAGLDKLTPAERQALDNFLIRYTAEDASILISSDEEVKKAIVEQEIVSTIVGPFEGWSGNTRFQLENGQLWQQRTRGNYYYKGPAREVKITKNFMGFHRMELVENGKAVGVKRIK
jgi:hypothetical protein